MAKVKVQADIFDDEVVYTVRSTSLTAALERVTVVVEALGPRLAGFDYEYDESRKRPRHKFYIHA